jgi:hypothetical protein
MIDKKFKLGGRAAKEMQNFYIKLPIDFDFEKRKN